MEMTECGVEHFIWNEGWPHPGEAENGKGRLVEVNGGQGKWEVCVFVEHE